MRARNLRRAAPYGPTSGHAAGTVIGGSLTTSSMADHRHPPRRKAHTLVPLTRDQAKGRDGFRSHGEGSLAFDNSANAGALDGFDLQCSSCREIVARGVNGGGYIVHPSTTFTCACGTVGQMPLSVQRP